jgi:two-component system OmpR family sensor kinase
VSRLDGERLRVVVHELRSPVAALAALAAAAPAASDPVVRRRLVELAVAAARDVERLVSDPELLSLRLASVDLAALVATFSGPTVEVRTAAEGALVVRGDATRLRQAVSNLVANALRHGTRATLEAGERNGRVEVLVSDDGPGIAEGLDPFSRGASGAGSTGYGLWLARAIAEAHGGALELVGGAGDGARLRLSLPSASGAA